MRHLKDSKMSYFEHLGFAMKLAVHLKQLWRLSALFMLSSQKEVHAAKPCIFWC